MKRVIAALAGAVVALVPLLAAPSAYAEPILTVWQNAAHPNRCLDYYIPRDAPYANEDCNLGKYQTWIWNDDPGVWTPMRHNQSEYCIYASETNLLVEMKECETGRWQFGRWAVNRPPGSEWAFIKNYARPSLCLANTGGETIRLLECRNNDGRVRWGICPECHDENHPSVLPRTTLRSSTGEARAGRSHG